MNFDSKVQLMLILLESGLISIEEAKELLEDRELEKELQKTALGRELL
jgi:hypothetical protein